MIDVVLPCLDEAAALPWVLTRMPEGYRAIVADNGSTDGSAEVAAAHGARVVHEPRRGFGAACHAGLLAATATSSASWTPTPRSTRRSCPRVVGLLAEAPTWRSAGAVPSTRRAWPPHARVGNAARSPGAWALHDLGPMRAARRDRPPDLGLTDRRSGYPLEMVLRARRRGWRDRRDRRRLPARVRAGPRSPARSAARCRPYATCGASWTPHDARRCSSSRRNRSPAGSRPGSPRRTRPRRPRRSPSRRWPTPSPP